MTNSFGFNGSKSSAEIGGFRRFQRRERLLRLLDLDNSSPPPPVQASAAPPTEQTTFDMRFSFLESESRKQTATINHLRSRDNANEDLTGRIESLTSSSKALTDQARKQAAALHNETQWCWAKTSKPLYGLRAPAGELADTLSKYRRGKLTEAVQVLASRRTWVLLTYPMEVVKVDGGSQYLMRMKEIDPTTGQFSEAWAIVYELKGETEKRFVERFALSPT